MSSPLKLGIAGLGTVGAGVLRLLRDQAPLIAARAGRPVVVQAVSARRKRADRGVDLSGLAWHDDPVALAQDPAVDVVVELIGGAEGAAFDLAAATLRAGKPLITANKALISRRGAELRALGGSISCEAAVAGGIPVVKGLKEGLAANETRAIFGILNGTCNFILSSMAATGMDFAEALRIAQEKGYAEADPSFDIDGIDAAHKLSILSAIAFGVLPDFAAVRVEGIRRVEAEDIAAARALGYAVRLLGIARANGAGVEQSVEPCLVPLDGALAAVEGVTNAVRIEASHAGPVLFVGAGAGANPTASAVVADVIDLARGRTSPLFGVDAPAVLQPADQGRASFYLRLNVVDKPGVLADVSALLRDAGVSISSVLQRGRDEGKPVSVVIVTHETPRGSISAALEKIAALPHLIEPSRLMRIVAEAA